MFDYFVGPLRCEACGYVCKDSGTNMQTKIARRPFVNEFTVGDTLDADWGEVCSTGYLKISDPVSPDTITLLEMWECPNCHKPFNWARITIVRGKIQSVEAVRLSTAVVQTANYITDDCRYLLDPLARHEFTVDTLVEKLKSTQQ